jgi:hypothetical protein
MCHVQSLKVKINYISKSACTCACVYVCFGACVCYFVYEVEMELVHIYGFHLQRTSMLHSQCQ